jgi:hypothetical protein
LRTIRISVRFLCDLILAQAATVAFSARVAPHAIVTPFSIRYTIQPF